MNPSRVELLELAIDLRAVDLMEMAAEADGSFSLDYVCALMRAAYGRGYTDALSEAVPGELCRQHGYAIPKRVAA